MDPNNRELPQEPTQRHCRYQSHNREKNPDHAQNIPLTDVCAGTTTAKVSRLRFNEHSKVLPMITHVFDSDLMFDG